MTRGKQHNNRYTYIWNNFIRGYKPPLRKQNKSIYINKCMNFILLFLILLSLIFIWTPWFERLGVLLLDLKGWESYSLIWKVSAKRWKNPASLMNFGKRIDWNCWRKPLQNTPQTMKDFFWGGAPLWPPRIISHSEVNLSIDSYVKDLLLLMLHLILDLCAWVQCLLSLSVSIYPYCLNHDVYIN